MKFTWATDIHLDFLSKEKRYKFYQELNSHEGEIVLLTGDIGNAKDNKIIFKELFETVEKPIYFVLGNHDYWNGTLTRVFANAKNRETYLTAQQAGIYLWDRYAICGVDGWYDLKEGRVTPRGIASMRDFSRINTFVDAKQGALLDVVKRFSDKQLRRLKKQIDWSLVDRPSRMAGGPKPTNMIILTHFPPFRRASLYYGAVCDEEKAPFYVNQGMGDYLGSIAADHPDCNFTVLCGHSHSPACYQPLPNLTVRCGGATYGEPHIQEFCEI